MAFEVLRARLAAAVAPREVRDPPGQLAAEFDVGRELTPTGNFRGFAREGYGKNEVVWSCIREVATSFAEIPLRVWSTEGSSRVAQNDHPFRRLIQRPNPFIQSEYEFWETLLTYFEVGGEAIVFRARNAAGITVELWPLRPDQVGYVPAAGNSSHPVAAWFWQRDANARRIPMATEDVLVVKVPNPDPNGDPVRGISPLRAGSRAVDADNRATDYVNAFMQNQGVPSGALQVKRPYDAELQKRLLKQWKLRHAGARKAGKLMVLWDETEFQQFAMSPKSMEFPQLRSISETRICMVFGVPPILIGSWAGLQRSTFANYGEARESFYDETILPLASKFAGAFQSAFVLDDADPDARALRLRDVELGFDRSEIRALLEDEAAKWTRVRGGFSAGLLGWRQSQGLLGLEEADPDDIFFVPMHIAPRPGGDVQQGAPMPPAEEERSGVFVRYRDLQAWMAGQLDPEELERRAVGARRSTPARGGRRRR